MALSAKIAITPKPTGQAPYEILDLIVVSGRAYLSLKDENTSAVTDETAWTKITENTYDIAARLGYDGTESEWLIDYVDSISKALAWQDYVINIVGALPSSGLTIGQRYILTTDNKIYTAIGANQFDTGTTPKAGWAVKNQNDRYIYSYNGALWKNTGLTAFPEDVVIVDNIVGDLGGDTTKVVHQKKIAEELNKKFTAKWLSGFSGAALYTDIDSFRTAVDCIKDIWFCFPNGKPSWWTSRTPQLQALLGSTGSPNMILNFRLNQSEDQSTAGYSVNITRTYLGKVELWKNNVTIGAGPTFEVYTLIDTAPLMGVSTVFLSSAQSQATQPQIVKKEYNSANGTIQIGTLAVTGKLSFNSTTKILTIPANTSCLIAGSVFSPVTNSSIDFSTVTGQIGRLTHIYYDLSQQKLVCSANTADVNNMVYGGDKVFIGTYDKDNNQIHILGWKWEKDGLDQGVDYIGNLTYSKTILFDTPIAFNPSTWKMVVAANTRILTTKGSVIGLTAGEHELLPSGQTGGYRHVYIKTDGTIFSSYFETNQTENLAKYMWIGYIHTSANKYDFPNFIGTAIIDTTKFISAGKFSEWLDEYKPISTLQQNLNVASNAIKDIWFEFPSGTIPAWFTNRRPMLRSLSNNEHNNVSVQPLRIYFFNAGDTVYNETYAIDALPAQTFSNGNMLLRLTKTIESVSIVVNIILNGSELYASSVPPSGLLWSSSDGLSMLPFIKKKTTTSVFSSSFAANKGTKAVILDKGKYIEYDSTTFKLTIPSNTRTVNYKGDVVSITAGQVDVTSSYGGGGYFNIFVDAVTGTTIPIYAQDLASVANYKYWDENRYVWIGWVHGTLGVGHFNSLSFKINGRIFGQEKKIDDHENIVPQIFNNHIKRYTTAKKLRLVCFGSSWFMSTWWYLNKIIASAGIDADLICFFTGGAYFSEWNNRFDTDEIVDAWVSESGADWMQTTLPFKTTLLDNWDIIAFQQGALQSRDWDGYWRDEWSGIVSRVKRVCGIDTVIAFNSTWTPGVNSNENYSLAPYANTVDGQKLWQIDNYTNTKRFMALSGIYNVAPSGAAMWVMRRNVDINNSVDLATDNMHPDNGLPNYALAGVFYDTFIAPMYGISFDTVTWLPDINTQKAPVSGNTFQTISTEQRSIIRQIIKLALSDRFGFSEI